jgi:hypothetical protein
MLIGWLSVFLQLHQRELVHIFMVSISNGFHRKVGGQVGPGRACCDEEAASLSLKKGRAGLYPHVPALVGEPGGGW